MVRSWRGFLRMVWPRVSATVCSDESTGTAPETVAPDAELGGEIVRAIPVDMRAELIDYGLSGTPPDALAGVDLRVVPMALTVDRPELACLQAPAYRRSAKAPHRRCRSLRRVSALATGNCATGPGILCRVREPW